MITQRDMVLEISRLRATNVDALAEMLAAVERAGETRHFRPHSFTREHLETLCDSSRRDLHYVLTCEEVIGYGLLRGWDEGYATPSLGIVVGPGHRGKGYGGMLMHFLHAAALARGAERVRLRVHEDNVTAIALYRAVGYEFDPFADTDGLLVAYKTL